MTFTFLFHENSFENIVHKISTFLGLKVLILATPEK